MYTLYILFCFVSFGLSKIRTLGKPKAGKWLGRRGAGAVQRER